MKKKNREIPSIQELEKELSRERYRRRYKSFLRSAIFRLLTLAAAAVLAATLVLPVFRIYGTSMEPTLSDGEIVISVKASDLEQGDIIAFYYSSKVLVKRVIAKEGQWVDINEDGEVFIDSEKLEEAYVSELALGECDIDFPYQVPQGKFFVLGDNRPISIDSRTQTVGCISQDEIIGRIVFRIWPFSQIGRVS